MNNLIKIALILCPFCSAAKAQKDDSSLYNNAQITEPPQNKNTLHYTHYRYFSITPVTGGGVSIPFHSSNSSIAMSFPYTSTDVSTGITTNQVFQSNTGSIVRNNVQPYWDIFGYEIGGLKHFLAVDISLGTGGNSILSTGYGFMWYFNGWGEHGKEVVDKRFVFKASMNLVEEFGKEIFLGTIDNNSKKVNLLGYTAQPTFDVTTTITDADGNSTTETNTYQAQNINVYYSQFEGLLIPEIGIGNNPYRGGGKRFKCLWNLSLGYNIPYTVSGRIDLTQNDGNGNSNKINNSPISFNAPGVTFLYNGKQTTSTPFRFSSGLYISFTVRLGWIRSY